VTTPKLPQQTSAQSANSCLDLAQNLQQTVFCVLPVSSVIHWEQSCQQGALRAAIVLKALETSTTLSNQLFAALVISALNGIELYSLEPWLLTTQTSRVQAKSSNVALATTQLETIIFNAPFATRARCAQARLLPPQWLAQQVTIALEVVLHLVFVMKARSLRKQATLPLTKTKLAIAK